MTISNTTSRISYTGNGILTVYNYPFELFDAGSLQVYVAGLLKATPADYSVNLTTKEVTFVVAPPSLASIILMRVVPMTQLINYVPHDSFPADTHERGLDLLTMMAQQAGEALERTLKVSTISTLTSVEVEEGTDKFLKWNALGTGIEAENVVPTGQDLSDYAKLPGRAGGQIIEGGTGASEDLTLQSTANATRGKIKFGANDYYDEVNRRLFVPTFFGGIASGGNLILGSTLHGTKGKIYAGADDWFDEANRRLEVKAYLARISTDHEEVFDYDATPLTGKRLTIWHGTDETPTGDGVYPTLAVQRVDNSTIGNDSAHIIRLIYGSLTKVHGATSFVQSIYGNVADLSHEGDNWSSQCVAVGGSAVSHEKNCVWGLYGEAHGQHTNSVIIGCELGLWNTITDRTYIEDGPFTLPTAVGLSILSSGGKKVSLGIGMRTTNDASRFGVGIYMGTHLATDYALDLQCQPQCLIRFRYGCSNDGIGTVIGGIGLDCGASATYGTGANQGAIHLRGHKFCFGTGSYMIYTGNLLEFYDVGNVRRGYIDFVGADHAL